MGMMGNSECDKRCDMEQCGYDQAMCQQSASILPCTEWGTPAWTSTRNSDGIINGEVEIAILKSLCYNPALDQESTLVRRAKFVFWHLTSVLLL
jgi:hypothetical protein